MIRTSSFAAAMLMVLAIAACSPQAATSPSADTPSDAPSDASSVAASASEQASASSEPTQAPPASIAADVDLATLLPTMVAGQEWTIQSGSGADAAGFFFGAAGNIAEEAGIPLTDLDWASAAAPNADNAVGHVIWAIRFPGAEPTAIVDGITTGLGAIFIASGQIEVTEETIDGKAVSVMPANPDETSTYYIYPVGDVVFVVQTPDRAEAEDAIGQLP